VGGIEDARERIKTIVSSLASGREKEDIPHLENPQNLFEEEPTGQSSANKAYTMLKAKGKKR